MTAIVIVTRYGYDPGPCLHCERPKEDHPAAEDPPVLNAAELYWLLGIEAP